MSNEDIHSDVSEPSDVAGYRYSNEEAIGSIGKTLTYSDCGEAETLNKIDLVFSRKETNKYDRNKVERFWLFLDSKHCANVKKKLMANTNYHFDPTNINRRVLQSQCSTEDHSEGNEPRLRCKIEERNTTKPNKSVAVETLLLLKSQNMDKIALCDYPIKTKEGSPQLANEIYEENMETVKNGISQFEKSLKEKNLSTKVYHYNENIRRDDKRRGSKKNNEADRKVEEKEIDLENLLKPLKEELSNHQDE